MTSPSNSKALSFIFITLLIDVIGLGIIIPVLPALIEQITGGDISEASRTGGWLTFAYAAMQFLFSPVIGGLSDRYGRRPVLLASLLGFGLDYILMGFAPTIGWLFLGRLIAGITGASYTTAGAYIADVSTPEKRAQNFGLIGVAFGVGFIIGPVLGGLLGHYSPRLPFFVAAGLALLNALYGYFVLPESLTPEHRRPFDWKRANPIGSLRHLGRYPVVLSLVISFVLLYLSGHATQSTWTFYTIEKFGWNEQWVGYSLGFVGLMVAIVQGGLIRIVIPKLGQKRSVFVGLTFYTIGFFLFAIATKGWMMFLFVVPFAMGGFAGPALQSIITSAVPANEQGELQGALTSLISLTSIFGPLMMTNLFSVFSAPDAPVYFPGAPFMMGALLSLLSIYFSMRTLTKHGH
ncbi:MAG: TCR/Tet family MFS transporter [Bacteroidota bacterium]|jgi:DHA1 family tetracycline resistance protein-like MFS transporter|uniref:TCR/Tet family MFS transporter n=1 Tax=Candidatus Pollutiaquabacter sp. TaxID=3416354 RepID=UPI001B758119|nr:TCR/Tet family MFS transporter [Bacteroidota bacterium]MBP7269987.1 TCR/Tet family MFS transporter [Bacteroidia bacterium]MBP7436233.1 TCR/Tet family MFS transporter [Bacteroidia bacterium]MBP7728336.1 TCR/Tet family MFS transporter [Bacteroidia bacterium]MBP7772906.1 TCR/Tet family MFS transporter [Bacteroidia bacterium]